MRTMRRGFTLIELTIVIILGMLVIGIIYQSVHLLLRSEDRTDKGSMRAIMEARMMETLLKDVRSASDVQEIVASKQYKIVRYVLENGRAVSRDIVWKLDAAGRKVTRDEPGPGATMFDFTELMDFDAPPVQFRIQKTGETVFDPGAVAPPGP